MMNDERRVMNDKCVTLEGRDPSRPAVALKCNRRSEYSHHAPSDGAARVGVSWRKALPCPHALSAHASARKGGLAGLGTRPAWPSSDVLHLVRKVAASGGRGERLPLGIELRDRYDATLVLSASARGEGYNLGLRCDVDAICVRPYPATTRGEASTIAALTETYGWDHVTVATTRFHTTRARVLFRQCLGDRVSVVGARPTEARGLTTYVRETVGTLAALTVRRSC